MDDRLQRRVQRYGWDRAAEHYEEFWAAHLAPAHDLLLEMADPQPGWDVLEIACGTGLVTARLADAVGPDGSVTATDLSEAMVETIRSRADGGDLDGVRVRRMGAEELDAADESVDAVICSLGLMYVPDPTRALGEFARVLRPGGTAAVSVWGERAQCGWAEIFPVVDRRVRSQVCPLFFRLGTGDTLRVEMESAGFEDVLVERIATTLHYETADEAVGAAFLGGPVALAYGRFDESTREEVRREYLESISTYRDGERWAVPGAFVIARGTAP